jgi:hypothetical protein
MCEEGDSSMRHVENTKRTNAVHVLLEINN